MKKILLQLDCDPQPSVFDSVVAVDADIDALFRHGNVDPRQVRDLVHGLMFTRAPRDLNNSAIFIGGSNVMVAESLLKEVKESFFGPLRVSVMFDANGSNTTAAAAIVCAARHLKLAETTAVVLAGTGPVGQRAARLLLRQGATVRLASRSLERAESVVESLKERYPSGNIQPVVNDQLSDALAGAQLILSAGAAGVQMLEATIRKNLPDLKVAIDLNAVPPGGLEGIEPHDNATDRDGQICYGAIGVGGPKMKIHKQALSRLFEQNDLVLDAEEIFDLGVKQERW
ncbi:MAG: NADP-dependent methylenetetrahydromethanopterin/methylenetetrahydrofolate dehydrogenase [Pirellulaceae bacterium]